MYGIHIWCPLRGNGRKQYIEIKTDGVTSQRYFTYEFRRYNFDNATQTFVEGKFDAITTINDVVGSKAGLTLGEVHKRLRIVGPNSIEMKRPSLWGSVVKEFGQPFYTYQHYILYTWVPLWYFYLAIIHGSCIIIGGLSAAYFHYRNELNLYTMTHINGDVECYRDGKFTKCTTTRFGAWRRGNS